MAYDVVYDVVYDVNKNRDMNWSTCSVGHNFETLRTQALTQ